ncbi:MAG: hypothetical protein HY598_02070 [Candidatus Omnitrophica bacterium]|nr:hypothetical protein [Candidatus Omnitrophota bacterium]
MPRRFRWAALLWTAAVAWAAGATAADSPKLPATTKFLFTEDTYLTVIDRSGPGSGVANLPTDYDISLLEMSWGGKQALFNGSGVTTNTSYPLPEGAAITTNDQLGFSAELPGEVKAGLLWGLYAAGGNRAVGRTFGAQLPWDNVERSDERALPPHVESELARAWIKDNAGPLTYEVTGGNLEALELTRAEWNFLNLGSLLWRPPVTTASIYGKGDRRYQPGRHPLRGVDAVASFEYTDDKRLRAELFGGRAKPTPVQEIDRDAIGARLSADVLEGNVGLTYVGSAGERNPSITDERQTLWALDGSYRLCAAAALYGAWAHTGYRRGTRLGGNAWVGGLRLAGPRKIEWRGQWQYIGENYDLMAYRKIEHYPSNLHGLHTSLSIPVGDGAVKGLLYRLHQIDTNTRPGDAIFGDSYFPALAESERGDLTAYRLGVDYDLGKRQDGWPKLIAYVEQAHFQKDAPDAANNDIDKYVTAWNLAVAQPLPVAGLTLEGSWRLVTAAGRWQAMRFHHRQILPEVALTYRIMEQGKEKFRAVALYHYYDFLDSIAASSGNNNYQANQMTVEVSWTF